MRKLLHRLLRVTGLHVERYRDPYDDLVRLVDPQAVTCCVDGGVYRGDTTKRFLRDFPKARVVAIEANPDLAQELRRSLADPRVSLHNQALTDQAGPITFHVPQAAFTGSILTPGEEFGASKQVTVPGVTLDELGIQPEVVKLDLQGAEVKALEGARQTMAAVKALLCEVNFVARYEGCGLFDQVVNLASRHGLHLFRLYEVHSLPSGQWKFADALFARGAM